MAANLKFVLAERENLRRVRSNFASIFEKYDRQFENDTVISMTDLSVVEGKDKLKKYKSKHFGYSKLKTKRGEKSFLANNSGSLCDDTLRSGVFRPEVELNSSGDTNSTDNLTVTTDNDQPHGTNATYHISRSSENHEVNDDPWNFHGNRGYSPESIISKAVVRTDRRSPFPAEYSADDDLDDNDRFLSLQGDTCQEVLSFIDSDTEEPSDAETLVTSSESYMESDDSTDDLSDSGFNTHSQSSGCTLEDKKDKHRNFQNTTYSSSHPQKMNECMWNSHSGYPHKSENLHNLVRSSYLHLVEDQEAHRQYHGTQSSLNDKDYPKSKLSGQTSQKKQPNRNYHVVYLSDDDEETDLKTYDNGEQWKTLRQNSQELYRTKQTENCKRDSYSCSTNQSQNDRTKFKYGESYNKNVQSEKYGCIDTRSSFWNNNDKSNTAKHRYSDGQKQAAFEERRPPQSCVIYGNQKISKDENHGNVSADSYHGNRYSEVPKIDSLSRNCWNDLENREPTCELKLKSKKRLRNEDDHHKISYDQAVRYLKSQDQQVALMRSPTSFRKTYMLDHSTKQNFRMKSSHRSNTPSHSSYNRQIVDWDEPDSLNCYTERGKELDHVHSLMDEPDIMSQGNRIDSRSSSREYHCLRQQDFRYSEMPPHNHHGDLYSHESENWRKPQVNDCVPCKIGQQQKIDRPCCSSTYPNQEIKLGQKIKNCNSPYDKETRAFVKNDTLRESTVRVPQQRTTMCGDQLNLSSDWSSPKGKLGKVYSSASDLTDISLLTNVGDPKDLQQNPRRGVKHGNKPQFYSPQSSCKPQFYSPQSHDNCHRTTRNEVAMSVPSKLIENRICNNFVQDIPRLDKNMSWNDKVLRWMFPTEETTFSDRYTLKAKRRLQLIPGNDSGTCRENRGNNSCSNSAGLTEEYRGREERRHRQKDGHIHSREVSDITGNGNESYGLGSDMPSSPKSNICILPNQNSPSTLLSKLKVSSPYQTRGPQKLQSPRSAKHIDLTGSTNRNENSDELSDGTVSGTTRMRTSCPQKNGNSVVGNKLFNSCAEDEDLFKKPTIFPSWRYSPKSVKSPTTKHPGHELIRKSNYSPKSQWVCSKDPQIMDCSSSQKEFHHRSPHNYSPSSKLVSVSAMAKLKEPQENRFSDNIKRGVEGTYKSGGNQVIGAGRYNKDGRYTLEHQRRSNMMDRTAKLGQNLNYPQSRPTIQSTPVKPNTRLFLNDTISTISGNYSEEDSSDEEIVTITEF